METTASFLSVEASFCCYGPLKQAKQKTSQGIVNICHCRFWLRRELLALVSRMWVSFGWLTTLKVQQAISHTILSPSAGGGVHIEPRYRQFPQLTRSQVVQGEFFSAVMWFWILWRFWHDSDAVLVSAREWVWSFLSRGGTIQSLVYFCVCRPFFSALAYPFTKILESWYLMKRVIFRPLLLGDVCLGVLAYGFCLVAICGRKSLNWFSHAELQTHGGLKFTLMFLYMTNILCCAQRLRFLGGVDVSLFWGGKFVTF
jgi:hypothetical protein